MIRLVAAIFLLQLFAGCKKDSVVEQKTVVPSDTSYLKYTILTGQHYCDRTNYEPFNSNQLTVKVKFDSSAIYKSSDNVNQLDVNKRIGFSEGTDHHLNSARIGWGWSKNALRLYAYVYADSARFIKELTTVSIGTENLCKITIEEKQYVFTVGNKQLSVPRALTGPAVAGYHLFPYFGGDETAPHTISIYIKRLQE